VAETHPLHESLAGSDKLVDVQVAIISVELQFLEERVFVEGLD
jgi:hypothetical protein